MLGGAERLLRVHLPGKYAFSSLLSPRKIDWKDYSSFAGTNNISFLDRSSKAQDTLEVFFCDWRDRKAAPWTKNEQACQFLVLPQLIQGNDARKLLLEFHITGIPLRLLGPALGVVIIAPLAELLRIRIALARYDSSPCNADNLGIGMIEEYAVTRSHLVPQHIPYLVVTDTPPFGLSFLLEVVDRVRGRFALEKPVLLFHMPISILAYSSILPYNHEHSENMGP